MVGSIAASIAQAAFCVLLLYGLVFCEVHPRRLIVFLLLWFAGRIGFSEQAQAMFARSSQC
jgi:hypothetical protein